MAHSININHLTVLSLTNNANINFGPTLQNSHTANQTIIGGNFSFGDHNINTFQNRNSGSITVPNENKDPS
ncbi:spore germination protein [Neobacillus muris]|uniref:spore germination protein n=1 Tax=Neobacillus muris TaxID=2941334 RepID=UPI00204077CA|nr:spore germination protein [Neobacillus muris]